MQCHILHKSIHRSVCICMSGYAFRCALTYRAEVCLGGKGKHPEVCEQLFEVTP